MKLSYVRYLDEYPLGRRRAFLLSMAVLASLITSYEAAIAPVYTMADLMADPHVAARGSMIEAEGVRMQGPVARLSRTPGEVRHPGRPLGADTDEVFAELDQDAGEGHAP